MILSRTTWIEHLNHTKLKSIDLTSGTDHRLAPLLAEWGLCPTVDLNGMLLVILPQIQRKVSRLAWPMALEILTILASRRRNPGTTWR